MLTKAKKSHAKVSRAEVTTIFGLQTKRLKNLLNLPRKLYIALHKICDNTGFHWPVFSRIRTEPNWFAWQYVKLQNSLSCNFTCTQHKSMRNCLSRSFLEKPSQLFWSFLNKKVLPCVIIKLKIAIISAKFRFTIFKAETRAANTMPTEYFCSKFK